MQASPAPEGLPAPTGRHQVGRTSFDAVYLPRAWAAARQFLGLDAAGVLSHAVAGAPVADEQSSYPVLVLSPSGFPPLLYAAIAEELASHGYVVVGVNHTDESAVTVFADGRVVPMNPDAGGRRAGTPNRTVPGVALDRPALQVLAEHPEFALSGAEAVAAEGASDAAAYDTEKAITFDGWRTVQQRARPGYTVQVKGATHLSFLDVPLLPSQGEAPVRTMLAATAIEPRRMWRITCDLLLALFAHPPPTGRHPTPAHGAFNRLPELSLGPP